MTRPEYPQSPPGRARPRPVSEVSPRAGPHQAFRRACHLARYEGPSGLASGVARYLRGLARLTRSSRTYYVYETPLGDAADFEFPAPRADCELRVIADHHEADALTKLGYQDFRTRVPGAARTLATGGVAVCAYVGTTFASIDWVAVKPDSVHGVVLAVLKNCFRPGHACTHGAFTVPEYRNCGLGSYRLAGALRYLRDHGYTTCASVIATTNLASRRCIERFGGQVVDAGRCRIRLTRAVWKTQPLHDAVRPVPPRRNTSDPEN